MSSIVTSTPATSLAPSSPTWSIPSFDEPEEGLWGVNTPEEDNPLGWNAFAQGQAWDVDWSITIFVLGDHGQPNYEVHYDHIDNLDTWSYISLGWTNHLHLPKNLHAEANMEARANAFNYWAQTNGSDPNNWLGELLDNIRVMEEWNRAGRNHLEHSTPPQPWWSSRLYLE